MEFALRALVRNKIVKVNLVRFWRRTGVGIGILGSFTKLLLFRLKIRMNFVEVAGRVDIIISGTSGTSCYLNFLILTS